MSLAGGAAAGPPGDTLTANTAVTLYEEEISDVSLSTFYVFDHEKRWTTSSWLTTYPDAQSSTEAR
jgi:hypothetical protein